MEREHSIHPDQIRGAKDAPAPGGHLDTLRHELDELLQAADQALDSLDYLQAEQYLQQNLQTGGQ